MSPRVEVFIKLVFFYLLNCVFHQNSMKLQENNINLNGFTQSVIPVVFLNGIISLDFKAKLLSNFERKEKNTSKELP